MDLRVLREAAAGRVLRRHYPRHEGAVAQPVEEGVLVGPLGPVCDVVEVLVVRVDAALATRICCPEKPLKQHVIVVRNRLQGAGGMRWMFDGFHLRKLHSDHLIWNNTLHHGMLGNL